MEEQELKAIEQGKVYFIGAGPGDPELITVRGAKIIEAADLIVYAGSLVPRPLLSKAKKGAEIHDSASLSLEETHGLLSEGAKKGMIVARVHTGDPALYGAIQEQIQLLAKEEIPYEVVPGVTVAFAAAATLGRQLTQPGGSQTLILTRLAGRTPVPESENLAGLSQHQASLVVYLSVSKIGEVVAELKQGYPADTPVVVACRVARYLVQRITSKFPGCFVGISRHDFLPCQALKVAKMPFPDPVVIMNGSMVALCGYHLRRMFCPFKITGINSVKFYF